MTIPTISVIMPVFNAEKYIHEAIESILNQTFTDFEFIIINDGSSDASQSIILGYKDPRIKLFNNDFNMGLVFSLNKGIRYAKGKYIARMDADDISLPDRFETQLAYLEQYNDYALVGSSAIAINEKADELFPIKVAVKNLAVELFWKNPIVHSSVMGRKEIFAKYYYNSDYYTAEDYYLWSQISLEYPVANIERPLMKYRVHNESISVQKSVQQEACVQNIYLFHLSNLGLTNLSSEQIDLHYRLIRNKVNHDHLGKRELWHILNWICLLRSSNNRLKVYNITYFNSKLKKNWESYFNYYSSFRLGIKAIPLVWDSFNRHERLIVKILFILRCFKAEIRNWICLK
jgi:glycosyltransferase involved in cell wall biosynthesis